jgi:hypothetical protein
MANTDRQLQPIDATRGLPQCQPQPQYRSTAAKALSLILTKNW